MDDVELRLQLERVHAEAQVLEEVDRILNLERKIKKAQISLMVRIKNTLTPQQQAKLAEIRSRMG